MTCLTQKGKDQLFGWAMVIVGVITIMVFILTVLSMGFAVEYLTYGISDNLQTAIYLAHYGIVVWIVLIPLLLIVVKRWLQNNIVKC